MDYMKNSACFDDKNTIDYFINLKKYYELKSKDEENANKFLKTQPPSFHKYKKRLEKDIANIEDFLLNGEKPYTKFEEPLKK